MAGKKLMKLRGRIIERYGTMGRFAEAVGMTRSGMSIKLNRGSFTSEQIRRWADLLQISDEKIADYFLE